MKSKDLTYHLTDLESKLSNLSFEKLTAEEATNLKKSFNSLKSSLEEKLVGAVTSNASQNYSDVEPEGVEDTKKINSTKTSKGNLNSTGELLVAKVSHEIRTPLNGIIGFTDLLKESNLSVDQEQHVNAIQSASYNLMDIINELLEYSKLSAGLEHFESVNFNFYSLVRDVMYLCNTLIMEKEVRLEVDMDTKIPEMLVGDPSKLSQILLNLIGNAIKFVNKGDIHLKINSIKQNSEEIVLDFNIIDTGIGISEEQIEHIFDTFRQAEHDTFKKYGGSGLGLSIVKQIIENLNGKINVTSTLGVGTTFKFELPFIIGTNVAKENDQQHKANINSRKELVKGMQILVFEDNLLNQKLIETRLKSWGCIVHITDNARYGLNILENNKIDLVFMDLRMPVMDGFEVTRRIRSSKNTYISQIPVIALTADFSIKDKEQCQDNGINDYILKPYSPDELLLKLTSNRAQMEIMSKADTNMANPSEATFDEKSPKIDLKSILEECMGEMDLLEELVSLYKQNALEFIGNVKHHLKLEDFESIQFAAHKMKSGLAMMQTFSLHSIVVQMHKTCMTDRDMKYLEFLYDCFLDEYPVVVHAIELEMEKMK
ncbi:ATP-binding protein [Sediminicola sp. 1XM1-17]|uniref:ATP-binding protein n=1 Tax=Sediminicola sp. 1XM1-17 TaxID=3127702 RepID=UPI003078A33B